VALNWARRLKRVFGIEMEQCARCGGRLEVTASIEEPELIERILAHRREQEGEEAASVALGARAPPQPSPLAGRRSRAFEIPIRDGAPVTDSTIN
jgi:hypothetical protein